MDRPGGAGHPWRGGAKTGRGGVTHHIRGVPARGWVMQSGPGPRQGAAGKSRAAAAALGSVAQEAVAVSWWGRGGVVPRLGRVLRAGGSQEAGGGQGRGGVLRLVQRDSGRADCAWLWVQALWLPHARHLPVGSIWVLPPSPPAMAGRGWGAPLFNQTHTTTVGSCSLQPALGHPVPDPIDLWWLEMMNP